MNATVRSTSKQEIHSYAELQEKMHYDLLAQHPEWIDANGNCPTCEDYDRRFAELISLFRGTNLKSVRHAV